MKRCLHLSWFGTQPVIIALLAAGAMACSSAAVRKPSPASFPAGNEPGSATFNISGVGGDAVGDCSPGFNVTATVLIFGGAKDNQAGFVAMCGDQVVANCSVKDSGDGAINECSKPGQQVKGKASCVPKYASATGGGPPSTWIGSCSFF